MSLAKSKIEYAPSMLLLYLFGCVLNSNSILCDAHTKDRHRDREQEERERESGVFLRERKKQEVRNYKRVCVCI